MKGVTDEEILDLYWRRSQDAISRTSEKYGSYCFTVAHNILYSYEDSEECVNDTWLRAWDSIPPTRPGILKAFLGKITRNLALNRYEKKHTKKRGSGEVESCLEELEECVSSGEQPDTLADQIVLTQVLNQFLAGMKAQNRRVFVQRYWYMMSVKEIAREQAMGQSQVKMILMRQREKLRELLEKEGIDI